MNEVKGLIRLSISEDIFSMLLLLDLSNVVPKLYEIK